MSPLLNQLKQLDENVSRTIYNLYPKSKKSKELLRGLEVTCHGIGWLVVSVVLVYHSPSPMSKQLLVGVLINLITVAVAKALSRRRRPNYAIDIKQEADKNSFPSGHAAMATFLTLYAHRHHFLSPLATVWWLAVVLSRVCIGRHFVTDAIGSALVGYVMFVVQFNDVLSLNSVIMWLSTTLISV